MNIKRIAALTLAALTVAAFTVGCKKKEPTVEEYGGSNTDLATDADLGTQQQTTGTYAENITAYSTGNAAIDKDFQKQLKDLSARFQSGYMPEHGDYTFSPEIEKIETDNYISLIANVGTNDDNFYAFTYNKKTGKIVTLEEVLSPQDYKNLSSLVAEGMKSDPMLADGDTGDVMFKDNVGNPNGFAVDQDQIIVYYAPLSILPHMHGTPVVYIPMSSLSQPIQ